MGGSGGVNLNYDYMEANTSGELGHAQDVMRSLGISYTHSTPQSMGDCWWFWNCANVPETLPAFLSPLTVKPHDAIGYGLSQEDADAIVLAAHETK